MGKHFLTAEWNNLIMANYTIDPAILQPFVPKHTELDFYEGKCYVSLIGFMFEKVKLLGFTIPFHVNFEEINLRFYVRKKDGDTWKRGAVFIKEIVPKHAITLVANALYREKYVTLPTKHFFTKDAAQIHLGYHWKFKKQWFKLEATTNANAVPMLPGSKEEFIAEHYWGYSKYSDTTTFEYGVTHPTWLVHEVNNYTIDVDFEQLYGPSFAYLNNAIPDTVFMAQGSPIGILHKNNLR
ncbi:YqjF family protein [Ferruginibacter yonginensis]|uniref:YqjF family protein n=1 Tax=Ferruginibacter yonginensis TaxID=1310416 RepID=A0ABV8QMD6_9BACT